MKQEDKELLVKDLCARLPYGVKVQCEDYLFTFDKDHMGIGMLYKDFNMNLLESPKIILSGCYYGEDIKPYLFPLSSMTEEQKEEYHYIVNYVSPDDTDNWKEGEFIYVEQFAQLMHFYHINHLDYRGLIPMGLAIDATGLNIY